MSPALVYDLHVASVSQRTIAYHCAERLSCTGAGSGVIRKFGAVFIVASDVEEISRHPDRMPES